MPLITFDHHYSSDEEMAMPSAIGKNGCGFKAGKRVEMKGFAMQAAVKRLHHEKSINSGEKNEE